MATNDVYDEVEPASVHNKNFNGRPPPEICVMDENDVILRGKNVLEN